MKLPESLFANLDAEFEEIKLANMGDYVSKEVVKTRLLAAANHLFRLWSSKDSTLKKFVESKDYYKCPRNDALLEQLKQWPDYDTLLITPTVIVVDGPDCGTRGRRVLRFVESKSTPGEMQLIQQAHMRFIEEEQWYIDCPC